MLSRQSISPKSRTGMEPPGIAAGTITGGFYHSTQLLSAPLPSQQLLGSDPVHQQCQESQRAAGSRLADIGVFKHAGSDVIGAVPRGRARGLAARSCRRCCQETLLLLLLLLPSSV